jgi:hypothetical protein
MPFLRRRHSLRLILAIGIIIMIILFFATLVQFDQIETNSYLNNNNNRRAKSYNSDESLRRGGNNVENENHNRNNNYDENEEDDSLNNDLERINFKNRLDNSLYQNRIWNRFNKIHADSNNFRKKANLKETMSKVMSSMQRYVHLDLKGSPPKLAYLKELIPFLKKVGASGLLIEYEDYFPYSNDLESIKNQNHYTKQEMSQLFALLKESQLKLIPLIQTYGHMEFVLKLKEFAYLREAKQHYQVITPCLNDTYDKVIFKMIDQILELHPEELEYIHIGCDEVYHVNVNSACKNLNFLNTIQDFFIYHVSRIVDYIKSKRPNLGVIIWDDMIRKNMQVSYFSN